MTLLAPAARVRKPNPVTQSYTALAQAVRDRGLLSRTRWFYGVLLIGLGLALGGVVTGVILLDDSWLQLLMAAALGVLLTQLAFVGHEASHRQVLSSGPANDRLGWFLAVVCVGMSYSWWMNKHTRHHGNPNKMGKDPDIEIDTFSFEEESAATRRGFKAWFTRRQGLFFFPLLLLEGINLHLKSVQSLWENRRVAGRRLELTVLVLRLAIYLTAVFLVLPLGMAFAFVGLQVAVFGLYMGASFAPNHIGMPIIGAGREAGLLQQAGPHLAQRLRRLVGHGVDGRSELPDRAPPVPEHAPAAPGHRAPDGAGALPPARGGLRREQPARGVGHRDRLPQPRRSVGPGLVPLPGCLRASLTLPGTDPPAVVRRWVS